MKNRSKSNNNIASILSNLLINHPWMFLIIISLITAISVFGAVKLKIDFSPQNLFETDYSESKELEKMNRIFGKEDKLLMILIQTENIFSVPVIRYIKVLSDELLKIKEIKKVESLTHLITARNEIIDNEETLVINKLLNEDIKIISHNTVKQIKQKVQKWPLSKSTIYSETNNYTVIAAEIDSEITKIEQVKYVIEKIERLLKKNIPPNQVKLNLAGIPYFRVEVIRKLVNSQWVSMPVTFIIFSFVLYFLFKRIWLVIFQLSAVAVSLVWALGIMGSTGENINIINHIITTVVFVIVISDTVHFLIRYDKEQSLGLSSNDSLKRSLTLLVTACFLTSFTSAVGFSSLIVARTTILKQFGIYLGLAILVAYPVTILLTSALLKIFPQKPKPLKKRKLSFENKMEKLGYFVLNQPGKLLTMGLLLVGIFIAFASRVSVDTHAMNVFKKDNPVRVTNQIMEKKFIGVVPLSIIINSEEENLMKQPFILKRIEQLQKRLKDIVNIRVSISLADYVKEFNYLTGEGTKTIPEDFSMTSQLLEFAEMSSEQLPLEKVVNFDFSKTRIRTWLPDSGGTTHLKGFVKINEAIRQIFGEIKGVTIKLSGSGYVAARNIDYLVRDLFSSLLLASIIIFLVIGLLFRSVMVGVLSIIPNMMPLIITIGYMGIRGYDLDASTVIIFSISLGMAVDSTIHFIARFLESIKEGKSCDNSIILAYKSSGKAIIYTTFLFLCGFLVLFSSDFMPARLFAELTSLTLLAALFGDLIILPALLKLFYPEELE